jgi:nitrite reductase (cytochrome c-552)
VDLIGDLKSARAANVPAEQLAPAQELQRKAQFYLDFVEAENSSGFHAPQEALRILGESINYSRKGQLALRPPVKTASNNRGRAESAADETEPTQVSR